MNEIHSILFSFLFVLPNLFFSLVLHFFDPVLRCHFHSIAFSFLPFGSVFFLCLFLTFCNHCRVFGFVSLFRPFTFPCVILCMTHDIIEIILHNSVNNLYRVDDCAVTTFDHGSLALIYICPSLVAERMYRVSWNYWSEAQIWWTGKCDRTTGRQWNLRWLAWLPYTARHSSSS
jgi:hypothetical protein